MRPLVLRRDPPAAPSAGLVKEAALLGAAGAAGVPVPDVVAAGDAGGGLDAAYVVMERVDGETIPRKILRDDAFAGVRPRLAAQCGEILARLHRIDPDAVPGLDEPDQIEQFRSVFDALGQPQPVFEVAFRWLDDHRPLPARRSVVHGDFRNGNLMVGPDGIRAVLDWELAHVGDPLEDLGWLCARPWRFGSDLPVGGFGTYVDLVAAYEAAGGTVDQAALHWWETLATLKWGVMCVVQCATHRSGAVRSVELAAIGRRVCEVEWDLLRLLPDVPDGEDAGPVTAAVTGPWPTEPLHDAPSAAELVEAVREFLEGDVLAATDGRVRFHTRVAVNVLSMVERELVAGGRPSARYRAGRAEFGFDDDAAFAAAIRAGAVPVADVLPLLRDAVEAKVRIANPRYLERP